MDPPTDSNTARVTYPHKFFENKFVALINSLGGSFKVKQAQSFLLMSFYKIKLSCETENHRHETVVIGDEYDDEAAARENAFQKAYNLLRKAFYMDLQEIEKRKRRQMQMARNITDYAA